MSSVNLCIQVYMSAGATLPLRGRVDHSTSRSCKDERQRVIALAEARERDAHLRGFVEEQFMELP